MRKLVSVLIIGFLIIINFNLIQGSLTSSQKLSGVNKIEDKIEDLEKENKSLRAELEKANSSFYVEKEARDKLGFGKLGETTIVVAEQLKDQGADVSEEKNKSNLEKWFELILN